MLHIRPEQIELLQQVVVDGFVKRMVVHLNNIFPDRCQELGEEQIGQLARLSHQRAAAYGISGEQDVCTYLEVLFSLHKDDESGEDMLWAKEILEDPRLESSQKVDGLRIEAEQRAQK
jgi:hypothetical protein